MSAYRLTKVHTASAHIHTDKSQNKCTNANIAKRTLLSLTSRWRALPLLVKSFVNTPFVVSSQYFFMYCNKYSIILVIYTHFLMTLIYV